MTEVEFTCYSLSNTTARPSWELLAAVKLCFATT